MHNKYFLALFVFCLALPGWASAQIGIGTITPQASAALDVSSTNKGFLPPRMSWTEIQAIANPAAGLLVYDNGVKSIRMYTGTEWVILGTQQHQYFDAPGAFSSVYQKGTGQAIPYAVQMDAANNVYVGGSYNGTVTLGNITLPAVSVYSMFFGKFDSTGAPLWIKTMGNTSSSFIVNMSLDASGNMYIGGEYTGTVDFDPGAGVHIATSVSGSKDGFYAKYDAAGNWLWNKSVGGTGQDAISFISTDATSVYVSGTFSGTAAFNATNLTSNSGSTDVFVCKYQATDGNLGANSSTGWVRQIGSSGYEAPGGLLAYGGGVIASGSFIGTCTFNGTNKTALGGTDAYFMQFNSVGGTGSINMISGTADEQATSMATDAAGNLFVTGNISGTTDFDPSAATYNTGATSLDCYVAKYNSSFSPQWVSMFSGPSYEYGKALSTDAAGNVYVSGLFASLSLTCGAGGPVLTNTGTTAGYYDCFIAKLSSSGNVMWAQSAGQPYDDYNYDIAVAANGKHVFSANQMPFGPFIGFDHVKVNSGYFYLARYEE